MTQQARAWITLHATSTALALLLLTSALGTVAGGVELPGLGPVSLPDSFPLGALLPVVLGVAVGLFCHTTIDGRVVQLAPRRHRLVPIHALWVVAGTATAALAGAATLATDVYAAPAVAANVVLFAGLAVLLVIAGRADQAWLPAAGWCLISMVFGYRGGSSSDWYGWAFPLDPDVTGVRLIVTGVIWGATALTYSVRPLFGAQRSDAHSSVS